MFSTVEELKAIVARSGRKIIVIGPNVFGVGRNGKNAFRFANKPKQWVAWDCHGKTYVSKFDGGLHLDAEDNVEKLSNEECFIKIGEKLK